MVPKAERMTDLNGVHVLLAEDNSMNQFYARQLLSSWNIKTDIANNGIEVVEKARQQKYDIILMDLQMPVMDGIEALKNIRRSSSPNDSTPVICVSADAFEETRKMAMDNGMNDYLTKPINEEALFDIIVRQLGPGHRIIKASEEALSKENLKALPLLDLEKLIPVLLDDKYDLN